MITLKKVNIYKKHETNLDAWITYGTEYEKSILKEGDWSIIESIATRMNQFCLV